MDGWTGGRQTDKQKPLKISAYAKKKLAEYALADKLIGGRIKREIVQIYMYVCHIARYYKYSKNGIMHGLFLH